MEYPQAKPFVSVVIPVKNAERFLTQCLKSLLAIDYPKDKYEVIISDSDSTDRTRQIASSLGAIVIIAEGPSICAAKNSGFKKSKGEIIAFSDADCIMDRDWLANAVKYFKDEKLACVGGPSLLPEDETAFGKACYFMFSFPLFTGGSPYGLNFKEVREVKHNPGCNAIYRRSVLEKVMPVDEHFFSGEDVVMNKRISDLGYRFIFTPDTKVWHYRSSAPKRFFRSNFFYAIGRVMMWRESDELINPLHIIAGFGLPIILTVLALSWLISIKIFIALALLGAGCLVLFSLAAWFKAKSVRIALNVPLAVIFLLVPWSLGFMKELFLPTKKE